MNGQSSRICIFVLLIIFPFNYSEPIEPKEIDEYAKEIYYGTYKSELSLEMKGNLFFTIYSTQVGSTRYFKANMLLFKNIIDGEMLLDYYGYQENYSKAIFYTKAERLVEDENYKHSPIAFDLYSTHKSKRNFKPLDCDMKLEVNFEKVKNGDIHLVGTNTGYRVCEHVKNSDHSMTNFSVISSTGAQKQFSKYSRAYSSIAFIVDLIQMFLLVRQMSYSNTTARGLKLSQLCLLMMGLFDSFAIMMHVYLAITFQDLLPSHSLLLLTHFLIYSIFDMKFTIVIISAEFSSREDEGIEQLRLRLGKTYLKYCGILLLSSVIITMKWLEVSSILFCSFWIPQIIHNIVHGVNNVFKREFIVGMSLCKLFFFIYYYGMRYNNVFKGSNDGLFSLAFLLMIYLGVQAVLLITMDKFGPRFFIPDKWKPKKYSYFRPLLSRDVEAENSNDCVICLGDLSEAKHKEFMVTPCDHNFHTQCLNNWMEQQMKCPICRASLPCQF